MAVCSLLSLESQDATHISRHQTDAQGAGRSSAATWDQQGQGRGGRRAKLCVALYLLLVIVRLCISVAPRDSDLAMVRVSVKHSVELKLPPGSASGSMLSLLSQRKGISIVI